MSDLLETVSVALGTPADLVQRSAAARAAANGTSVEDVLAAWGGGAPVAAPTITESLPEAEVAETAPEPAPEPPPAPVAVMDVPDVEPEVVSEPEPEEALEPAPLGVRLKTSVRIGAWTGAALGVIGFLTATAFWAPNTLVVAETGPVVEVNPSSVMLGVALVSLLFGAIVAGMSRAATAWTDPAMQLSGSKSGTVWVGAVVGLILGVVAGAMLSGFGTVVEGSDPELTQLPVLATMAVMILGGAILGAGTAAVPQLLGVPVAVDQADSEEVEVVKGRLGNAIGIPMAGLLLLVILVLPFAFTLIESSHLITNGGAIVAVIASGGILGFAALAGSKPEMKISLGDVMVAVVGIGIVLVIIMAVLFASSDAGHEDESGESGAEAAAVVQLL